MSLLVDDCQTAENEKVEAFLLYRREFYSHICTNTQVTEPTDAIRGNINPAKALMTMRSAMLETMGF